MNIVGFAFGLYRNSSPLPNGVVWKQPQVIHKQTHVAVCHENYLHKQVVCWIWSTDHSSWTNLEKFFFSFFFLLKPTVRRIHITSNPALTHTHTHINNTHTRRNKFYKTYLALSTRNAFCYLLLTSPLSFSLLNANPLHTDDSSPADQKTFIAC